ncbi:unnamed protein product [Chrysodeixis includens]|uniref:Uncharacterized protein n=1 Tax=Chrysodeixis includens TaxID=689277 RepID=A0A9N8L283_CHRIL|nr:unnamed protein product [Chrysodeixis includens]
MRRADARTRLCASRQSRAARRRVRTSVRVFPDALPPRAKWRPNRDLALAGDLWWADGRVANTHADDMDTVWPRHIGSTRSDACRCRSYVSSQLLFKSQARALTIPAYGNPSIVDF